jgi:DegV family protein with EDD domain
MGGRIGKAKHLVASLLNIKPLIGMQDGVIVALGTARTRPKAYRRMVELLQDRFGAGARVRVAFMHVLAIEHMAKLRALVTEQFECVEVLETELSPALAVHSGPGTVGVSMIPA